MDRWDEPFDSSYRVMRVDPKTRRETGRITGILNGGSIDRNLDVAHFESGSLDFVGDPGIGNDLVAVYNDASFEGGAVVREKLGTFMASSPKSTFHGEAETGTLSLYGLLHMADAPFEKPFVVQPGTLAADAVKDVLALAGLRVVAEDSSDYAVGEQRVYGLGDDDSTMVSAANDLLDLMGFEHCMTNVDGDVRLRKYVDPASRAPAHEFVEGRDARFFNELVHEYDRFDIPNVVVVGYSAQDFSGQASAVDDDPASRYSIASVGRRIPYRETLSDLPEGCTEPQAKELAAAKARALLDGKQSVIRRITFQHIYRPLAVADSIEYRRASIGVSSKFAIRRQHIDLVAGCPVEEECREFVRR